MNPIIIIPARMRSERLPGKPLQMIAGKPMIVHVVERALEANLGPVVVAVAEEAIAEAVQDAYKARVSIVLTDPRLPSGTDRIHAALNAIDKEGKHDVVINLQGDLPTVNPAILADAILPFKRKESVDISTLVTEIQDSAEKNNPNVVKVAVSWDHDGKMGRALYFSRSLIPHGDGPHFHHIGIYAYTRAALVRFCTTASSLLERREKLEQLRALEEGMNINVVKVSTVPIGVDTPEDLERVRAILSASASAFGVGVSNASNEMALA